MEFSTDLPQQPHRVVEVTSPKSSRPLWQKILFLVLLVGVIAFIIFAITSQIGKKDTSETKKTTEKVAEKEATQSSEKTSTTDRCKPKQDLNNPKQGYQNCFESSWKQKELKVSGLEIGLGAGDINENSPGTINIKISDKSPDLVIQEINDNSSKFEFAKAKIGKSNATQTVITRQKSDPLIAYPQAIVTAVSKNSRTYVVTLNSAAADYDSNKTIYEQFLTDWEFLEEAADPPWSESRNILVSQPWPGDSVASPLTISGEAISFEGVVNVRVKDGNGKTLTETTFKTASGTERSPFSGNISFDKPKTSSGTIEVFNTSAKDGSDQDKVVFKINFQ